MVATFNISVASPGSASVTFQTLTDSAFEGEEFFLVNLVTVDSNMDVDTGTDWGTVLIQDQTSERTTWMTKEGVVMSEGHVCLCFSPIRGYLDI